MRRAGRFLGYLALVLGVTLAGAGNAAAQGVTTSSIIATVKDASGAPVAGARVSAVHVPSGTAYGATTRVDGRATLPGMRIGGPYRVSVVAIGFEPQTLEDQFLVLGVSSDLSFTMRQAAVALQEILVTAAGETVFSSERTGAATTVPNTALRTLPTTTGRIADFTRLVPQVRGTSFGGADARLNNITVDGAPFNNSFGLGDGQPGGRTSVAPIAIDAIEQLQVNIAPFDVRQGNFVGAGVNTVTKSGTNEFSGNLYYGWRNEGLVGTKAGDLAFNPGTFTFSHLGVNLGGPIIKNRLFFFGSYEDDALTEPGHTFRANNGGETPAGSVTRVLKTDLDALSTFLAEKFDYQTGPYQDFDSEVPAKRILAKLDFNLNERNKFSVRYNYLNSSTDQLVSNSNSLGRLGNRRTNLNAMSFQNSGYSQLENIRNLVGEWNANFGSNKSNNLIIGYAKHDESRGYKSPLFPLVDIEKDATTYTSFGFEPFTPNNELRYKSLQIVNNFTIYGNKHDLTFGAAFERYNSENVFFSGSQSVYVYNSLQDFYTDANGYLANPNRTTAPVSLRRFQVRWSNIPGLAKPIQPMEVTYAGAYVQDEFRPSNALKLTLGLRVDVPWFGQTGFTNPAANGLTFRDQHGDAVTYQTQQLPKANPLLSPRLGINWTPNADRSTQVRGGTGIFTGRPLYVWISNQLAENGMLTGFEQIDNTTTRPFNPNPDTYKPTSISGNPAATYSLAISNPDFKFPQVWRTNLAVDQRLPWGLTGTAEFIYNKDINGIYYINANLPAAQAAFAGADDRPRYTSNRIHSNITNAIVLSNQNVGYAWNAGASLEKTFANGFFAKAAYNYGIAKNTIDPGSIAAGSWNGNQHQGDPNNPGLSYSTNSPGHRFFAVASYRKEYFNFGATTVTLFYEGRTIGNGSYAYGGDLNNDGSSTNDLLYIPRNKGEMNFQQYTTTVSGQSVTFTRAQQEDAWEAYILQDKYLRAHRGGYVERGAIFMPLVFSMDFSIAQDVFTQIGGRRNKLQFRVDVLNFGNLLNKNWGVGQRFVNTQPLIVNTTGLPAFDANGVAQHRLRNIGTELMSKSFEPTSGINDVYRIQFSLRYTFN